MVGKPAPCVLAGLPRTAVVLTCAWGFFQAPMPETLFGWFTLA